MLHAVRRKMNYEDLRKLAHAAWTEEDAIRVLTDYLLEQNLITVDESAVAMRQKNYGRNHTAIDDLHYARETAVREWILATFYSSAYLGVVSVANSRRVLRVTGPWPDISYIVHEQEEDGSVQRDLWSFLGVEQPRLLRDMRRSSDD